jgi:hypothetical protein
VLEFNPVTKEVVWNYSSQEAGFIVPMHGYKFYSALVSSAQRLPNGNTLITEGAAGRIFEVTPGYEIVWEYISPYFGKKKNMNMLYRAYRLPYEWVPQIEKPEEKAVPRLDNSKFRVPGSGWKKALKVTTIKKSGRGFDFSAPLCVLPTDRK